MGTLNMLGLAKRVGARFLLTSTSEVYGDPLEHPQKETYWGNVNPIGMYSLFLPSLILRMCEDCIFVPARKVTTLGVDPGIVIPAGVRSCYDEGKRTAETLTMDYHRGDQVQVHFYLASEFPLLKRTFNKRVSIMFFHL